MTDEVTVAISMTVPAAAYERAKVALRNGRSAGSDPWIVSTVRCPTARRPRSFASGLTGPTIAAEASAAGAAASATITVSRKSCHTEMLHYLDDGDTREGDRARSRLALRSGSRRLATLLPGHPRSDGNRQRQGRPHPLLLGGCPSPRSLVRARAYRRRRPAAQGR